MREYREAVEKAAQSLAEAMWHEEAGCRGDADLCRKRAAWLLDGFEGGGRNPRGEAYRRALEICAEEA